MMRITNPKDFWAGTLYVVFGVGAVLIARSYPFGSATRMGPGYFPIILGVILALLGLLSLLRAFRSDGEPVGSMAWKPLLAITGGTALFAFLLPRAGLPLALAVLILMSAAISENFKFGWRPALALMALIAFCVIVFVKLLGVPLPLVGSWFAGLV
ncbi:tripartite tricarboxylate transporter TctB family protein [Rhizobium ruizarguesonis]|uniref:Tripartite tricarboxylate transporter TctB family protein n=1 Tax=Rhizobium ruizarguesonis TaxID=2081791 RepID=A0ABY1X6B6_9HYPH|nr:tripartite tricarboxylate transporter TctB family protein [Rhizobium ruizarguesonis]TAU17171.1 tripartite tricarboxylate transporter TctB family protein [Rhizobium ruizarguesonis]TAU57559.1 tripartite tricarboxylate transporter TctB family protein [Rhizobium ruizarguesonis]TAU59379.1 tripartite tricarboxylate transporter TctB family protein [Rhizobium ruizarguesonis]TAV03570.1 tripartite tricarboxylate transporter TctB family protein [Rhizobium ruizarguesonis]TAV19689.1 tripartite tricarbox